MFPQICCLTFWFWSKPGEKPKNRPFFWVFGGVGATLINVEDGPPRSAAQDVIDSVRSDNELLMLVKPAAFSCVFRLRCQRHVGLSQSHRSLSEVIRFWAVFFLASPVFFLFFFFLWLWS